ncbi:unnamed protein product [Allacma fusca]|uniref:Ig-like domain-containing protein n=1 Tax=Allacma fusca TaxID=39272 RepID=A0A8J2LDP7_9HEXA|nr:unnamed protein product [Allacma fusca]
MKLLQFTSVYLLLLFSLYFFLGPGESAVVRGKFDRFGKNSKKNSLGHYRTHDSFHYYENPNGANITKASHFETEYELGRKIVFFCTAIGNPRPHITWFKNGIELYAHSWLQVHEWIESENRIKSKMEIDPATQMDRGEYECLADNKWAIDRRRFRTDYLEME